MAVQPRTSNNASAHVVRTIPVVLNGRALEPNRGMSLNLDWIDQVRVNTSAVERRAATYPARRSVKKENQAAWLLRAIACIDLTTLSGDDTADRVRRLCAKARNPIERHIVEGLGIEELHLTTGAVCVYHAFIETAVKALEGSGIPVAAVSTGFPAGLSPLTERIAEVKRSVEAGASEIDIVIKRAHVFNGDWQALYDEIATFKAACGKAHLKAILGTGDLMTPDQYDDERTRSGDSGSGVYNAQSGGLVGIVVAGDGTVTRGKIINSRLKEIVSGMGRKKF